MHLIGAEEAIMPDTSERPSNGAASAPADGGSLEGLLDSLMQHLPEQLRDMRDELHKNFRPVLQNRLSELDLVSRDEFDAQSRMLARSRARLNSLQAELERLEADFAGSAGVRKN